MNGSFLHDLPDDVLDRAVELATCVPRWLEPLRTEAERKGLVLRCAIDADLPALLDCEPAGLRQIVRNLVDNAVRATVEGWVSVCVEPAWNDPRVLAISVTDTGPGMDAAAVRIALGEDTSAMRPAHWGLGLAISAGHAARLGGSLSLERTGHRGMRAELRIPLRASLPSSAATGDVTLVDERDIVRPLGSMPLGRRGTVRTERRKRARLALVAPTEWPGVPERAV